GFASRRTALVSVVLWSHVVGLVGVVLAAPLLSDQAPVTEDLVLGSVGGLFGLAGLVLLYRGLARGPMSVVAPLSALSSATVPLTYGLLDGERLSVVAAVGVAIGLVSIVLVSSERRTVDRAPVTTLTIGEALFAGVGFGMFFVFLDLADDASAPWPVVSARICTVTVAALVAVGVRPAVPQGVTWWWIAAAGVFDVAANVSFLLATGEGDLTVVSVLASLYPAATVLLAWLLLREPIGRTQLAGLGLAGLAIVLVGAG
ncbi:MAG: DMT family transporter, partial [Acidimicrobiia bacterium]|nr:DMT family transporter [Acidimicrobiia bacterium]